jgi:arginyl-tRNA--protein-N-Asp/Glu arginylyltransferase
MYLKWKEQTIKDFSDFNIDSLYNEGFVFGRTGKGEMSQTRSLRIDLSKFNLNSENRRVLKKVESLVLQKHSLPYSEYSWEIGKLGKDFYDTKFGKGTFSANKIKEVMTDKNKSNFNVVMVYNAPGYAICLETNNILHYCYPFYNLNSPANTGMGMMLKAINWAKENGKKYIYLGSYQRPTDVYKLQFEGLEWFDGEKWNGELNELKKTII